MFPYAILQGGRNAPHDKAILERVHDTRRWLKERPEKEIIVVAHGGLLHYFTGDWENGALYPGMYLLPLSTKKEDV